jgi:hypothetical protein
LDDFDIYCGWMVAFVDGQWRKVFISPGWITLAPWRQPNEHIGVFRDVDFKGKRPGEPVPCEAIGRSPYALVSMPVLDADTLDRIAFVRFGRVPTGNQRHAIWEFGDQVRKWAILEDLDDSRGIHPAWDRFSLPRMPNRWDRSARSLSLS